MSSSTLSGKQSFRADDTCRLTVGHNHSPDTFAQNLNAIARDGRIVNLATLSGMKLKNLDADFGTFVRKRVRYEGSSLRSRDEAYQGRLRDQLVEHALPKFKDGSFKIHIEKVYPWDQIQEAHKLMEVR